MSDLIKYLPPHSPFVTSPAELHSIFDKLLEDGIRQHAEANRNFVARQRAAHAAALSILNTPEIPFVSTRSHLSPSPTG